MQVSLNIRGLEVAYSRTIALKVPELSVHGRVIAVIGHNGSGKSTLLKTVLGLIPPKKGILHVEVKSNNQPLLLDPRLHMAFSPEGGAVFSDITVEGYVKLWCRIKYGTSNYYLKEGARFIEMFELSPLMSRLGRQLSKGERRRVQAAVGYLIQPRLFLFDEPFDGLDIVQTARFSEIMSGEIENTSVIFSSHRMEVVERLADAIIILEGGGVVAAGSIPEVCRKLSSGTALESSASLVEIMHQHFLARDYSQNADIVDVGEEKRLPF